MFELTKTRLNALAEQYGDSFYLLDTARFKQNFTDLHRAFSDIYPNFRIAYSYKTNYTPVLCRIVQELNGYAEVVSEMEMELALRVGVLPGRIIWNGPIKNIAKVTELLLTGGTVNIDSIGELNELSSLAKRFSEHRLHVGVRCNFDVGDGVISRFGLDTESQDFQQALLFISEQKNVHLQNLQCHFAKRELAYWPARAKGMAALTKRVASFLGYLPDRIDIGGGLYGRMDPSLKAQFHTQIPTYEAYAKAAATVFAEEFPDFGPELLIEPGSAIVGDCMRFIARVETIKKVRGKTYVTVLGSQKNISMSGVNPPLKVIPMGIDRKKYENADIVGYTCIENDVLYHGYTGELAIGDFLVFSNCGSYSIVMKPPFIHPNVPVLAYDGQTVKVVKRQEYFDDLFHTFVF